MHLCYPFTIFSMFSIIKKIYLEPTLKRCKINPAKLNWSVEPDKYINRFDSQEYLRRKKYFFSVYTITPGILFCRFLS